MRHEKRSHGERGATLIFFLCIVSGLLAVSGIVVDGGLLYAERRQQQNAADAAAMAGAQALDRFQRSSSAPVGDVWAAVASASTQNGADLADVECTLVDEVGQPIVVSDAAGSPILGAERCPGSPDAPALDAGVRLEVATGVRVDTAATRSTNFMSALGVSEFRAPGDATATLQRVIGLPPGAAPFMVCGSSPEDLQAEMQAELGGTFTPRRDDTLVTPLIVRSVDATGKVTWLPNPAAYYDPVTDTGTPIPVHGPQGVAQCGAQSNSFKGLVEDDADVTAPWIPGETGTRAGPTRNVTGPYSTMVHGVEKVACEAGEWHDCVMILPICSHSNGGRGAGLEMRCVMFGAFYVERTGANKHSAYLLGDAAVVVDGVGGGKPNDLEARMIKLYD